MNSHKSCQFIILLGLFIGCAASTIVDVPHLNIQDLNLAQWKTINPKHVMVEVRDERSYRKNSSQLVKRLSGYLEQHFKSADFQISDQAPQLFRLEVFDRAKLKQVRGSHSCVKLKGTLDWEGKGEIWSEATACYGVNHNLPVAWGSNISKAYEIALKELFASIDQKIVNKRW